MDNITHSLIGLAAAEGAIQIRRKFGHASPDPTWKASLWIASAIANNVADLDIVIATVTGQTKLGHLLHHRGFTHTLFFAPLIAVLILAGVYWRSRKKNWTRVDWLWMVGIVLLGPLLHIFADSWNSYGVHPFWPWDSRWYYGDFIFILEPALWMTLLPALIWASKRKAVRWSLTAIFASALGLLFFSGQVPVVCAIPLALVGLTLLIVNRKLSPGWRYYLSWASAWAALGVFFLVSLTVRHQVEQWIAKNLPLTELHETVLSPLPANPLCWQVLSVGTEGHDYVARKGVFAPFPRLMEVASCPSARWGENTRLRFKPLPAETVDPGKLHWDGEFRRPLSELADLYRNFCSVRKLMTFIRAPFWDLTKTPPILGDLRYDRGDRPGFTTFWIDETMKQCPENLPKWIPPRADLLREALQEGNS